MGCNQTKNEDIKKSQEARTRQPLAHPPSAAVTTIPMGISSEDKTADLLLGKSYTDQREGETDYLKRIIDTIEVNLIDTSTTLAQLGEKDAMERAKDYSKRLDTTVKSITLFELPKASTGLSPSNIFGVSAITNTDIELVCRCSDSFARTFALGMHVTECGPIVVSLK